MFPITFLSMQTTLIFCEFFTLVRIFFPGSANMRWSFCASFRFTNILKTLQIYFQIARRSKETNKLLKNLLQFTDLATDEMESWLVLEQEMWYFLVACIQAMVGVLWVVLLFDVEQGQEEELKHTQQTCISYRII